MSEPLLYTAEEAAESLGVSAYWLRRQAAARAIPCTYLGKRKLRFSKKNLEDLIAQFDQTTSTGAAR